MDRLAYRPRGAGATVAPDPPRAPPACDATAGSEPHSQSGL